MKPSLVCTLTLALLAPTLVGAQAPAPKPLVHERALYLPYSKQELTVRKTIDPRTGESSRIALAGTAPVDYEAALAREEAARWAAIGNLEPTLAAELDATDKASLQVLLKFAIDEPRVNKALVKSEADRGRAQKAERAAMARLEARAATLLAQRLGDLGVAPGAVNHSGPFVALELPVEAIRRLSRDRSIAFLGLLSGQVALDAPTITQSLPTTRTQLVHAAGFQGNGVRVGILEPGYPTFTDSCLNFGGVQQPLAPASRHLELVGSMIGTSYRGFECLGGSQGYAPFAKLYFANAPGYVAAYEWAASQGVNVVNLSWHEPAEETNGALSARDIYFDYWTTRPPYPTIVASAGDQAPAAYASGKGYNMLSVGDVANDGDGNRCNDVMAATSSFRDPLSVHSDREVPNLAAPGTDHDIYGALFGGTSAAAPVVSGIVADLMSQKVHLTSWPEAVRAILLAGANYERADGAGFAHWAEGKDGVGMVNAKLSSDIASAISAGSPGLAQAHDFGTLTASRFAAGYLNKEWQVAVPAGTPRLRVAFTWNSKVNGTSSMLDSDLDLHIAGPDGGILAFSSSWDNNVEFVEFAPPVAGTYTIKVLGYTVPADLDAYFGVAWATHGEVCP